MILTKQYAEELQAAVNDILRESDPAELGGPVNWADLKCTDVTQSLLDGTLGVLIEEADPHADALREHVAHELELRGYLGVVVTTEW